MWALKFSVRYKSGTLNAQRWLTLKYSQLFDCDICRRASYYKLQLLSNFKACGRYYRFLHTAHWPFATKTSSPGGFFSKATLHTSNFTSLLLYLCCVLDGRSFQLVIRCQSTPIKKGYIKLFKIQCKIINIVVFWLLNLNLF